MVDVDDLIRGGVYLLKSRNLILGVYEGSGSFIGIREKFSSRYLDCEFYYGETWGTAKPLKLIGAVPESVNLSCHYKETEDGPYKENADLRKILEEYEGSLEPCSSDLSKDPVTVRGKGQLLCEKKGHHEIHSRVSAPMKAVWSDIPADDEHRAGRVVYSLQSVR